MASFVLQDASLYSSNFMQSMIGMRCGPIRGTDLDHTPQHYSSGQWSQSSALVSYTTMSKNRLLFLLVVLTVVQDRPHRYHHRSFREGHPESLLDSQMEHWGQSVSRDDRLGGGDGSRMARPKRRSVGRDGAWLGTMERWTVTWSKIAKGRNWG